MLTLTSLGEILRSIFSTPFDAIRLCHFPPCHPLVPPSVAPGGAFEKGLVFPGVLSRSSRATP